MKFVSVPPLMVVDALISNTVFVLPVAVFASSTASTKSLTSNVESPTTTVAKLLNESAVN